MGQPPLAGINGAATSAQLNKPYGVAVDAAGNLYIDDYNNVRIRKVDTSGIITTVAGNGTGGFSGDNGPATSAKFLPSNVGLDSASNLCIADAKHRIRFVKMVAAPPALTTPPALTADTTDNTVGQPVTISFTDDFAWRSVISAVYVNGTSVAASAYSVAAGTITIDASLFPSAGSYTVVVKAAGYSDVTVTQRMINPGSNTPTVKSTDPANGATNVSISKTITVTFSEDLQPGTDINLITVKSATYNSTVNCTPNFRGNTLSITLNSDLDFITYYTVTVPASAVMDAAGNVLAESYSFSFTTAAQITGGIIAGNVVLEGLPTGKFGSVTVLAKDGLGKTVVSSTYSGGTYCFSDIPTGTYTVWFSAPKYLTKKVREAVNLANVELVVGDVNGDNIIDLADLGYLSTVYGITKNVSAGFNANCDFNDDGIIDLSDLGWLASNYGLKVTL